MSLEKHSVSEEKHGLEKVEGTHSVSLEPKRTKHIEDILRKNKQYIVDLEDEDIYD